MLGQNRGVLWFYSEKSCHNMAGKVGTGVQLRRVTISESE